MNVYVERKSYFTSHTYCMYAQIVYISLLLLFDNNHTIYWIFVNWRRYFLVCKYWILFYTPLHTSFHVLMVMVEMVGWCSGAGRDGGIGVGDDDTAYIRIRFDILYHSESIWKNVCNRHTDNFKFAFIYCNV